MKEIVIAQDNGPYSRYELTLLKRGFSLYHKRSNGTNIQLATRFI
jgi:hypothetical protein